MPAVVITSPDRLVPNFGFPRFCFRNWTSETSFQRGRPSFRKHNQVSPNCPVCQSRSSLVFVRRVEGHNSTS